MLTSTTKQHSCWLLGIGLEKDDRYSLAEKGANDWDGGMYGAVTGGHKDLVLFFIEKGANRWNSAMRGAAARGHKDLEEFFRQKIEDN